MFNSIHEECGVFGIFENKTTHVARSAYLALYALQHRGQESCGIAVNDDGVFPTIAETVLCLMFSPRKSLRHSEWGIWL